MAERTFTVGASVQCLGTTCVEGELPARDADPELYEALAVLLGPRLLGWEQGDTIWLAASSRAFGHAEAPIKRVRELHRPVEYRGVKICVECSDYAGGSTDNPPILHPCLTVQMLDEEESDG